MSKESIDFREIPDIIANRKNDIWIVLTFIREYSSPFKDLEHIHTAAYARDLLEVGRQTPDMRDVSVPILVIGSSAGAYTDPARMRRWVDKLADAQMETVECVHWPLTECPREVSAVIEHWIRERF